MYVYVCMYICMCVCVCVCVCVSVYARVQRERQRQTSFSEADRQTGRQTETETEKETETEGCRKLAGGFRNPPGSVREGSDPSWRVQETRQPPRISLNPAGRFLNPVTYTLIM